MNRKAVGALGLALVMTALALAPAWAGGWAVVTLDSIPGSVTAGNPVQIGFTVRQHGITPRSGLVPPPMVEARLSTTGEISRFEASDSGATGHYAATILLPSAGTWTWGIRGFGDQLQPMPPLRVLAAGGAEPAARVPLTPLLVSAGVAAAAGLLLLSLRRVRLAAAVLGLAALLSAGGFLLGGPDSAQAVEAAPSQDAPAGAELFLAKGCVVCHVHTAVAESAEVSISVGPELTAYHNTPEFLRAWLANPAGVRPSTEMPNLHLSSAEIEALIAFLNQDA